MMVQKIKNVHEIGTGNETSYCGNSSLLANDAHMRAQVDPYS